MGVTAQSSPKMNGLLVLSTLAAASAQVVLPYGGLAGYPYGYAGYPYAVAKPVVNEVEVPCPSCSTPPSTPAARTPSVTPCPASRRERRARRGLLTRRLPGLPPLLPPSFPTDLDSDTTVLAMPVSAMLDSTTPMPSPPLPLLRLRCP